MKKAICPSVSVFSSQPKNRDIDKDTGSQAQSHAELKPNSDEVAKKTFEVNEGSSAQLPHKFKT